MTDEEANKIRLGLYVIHWRSGGSSLASVGMLHSGRRWFAPCNWSSLIEMGIASVDWDLVKRVTLIRLVQ